MLLHRALAVSLMALGVLHFAAGPVKAQLAEQALKIVFPFAAGDGGDTLTRLLAEDLRKGLGRSVVVENRSGAAGRLGIQSVKGAPADGLTLLVTPVAPMAVFQHIYSPLGYDPFADFVPVSLLVTSDFALAVAPNVPVKSLAELVTWVKTDASRASFGTPAAGSLPHFLGLQLSQKAGLDLQHVNYRGSQPVLTDLMGGQLPIAIVVTWDAMEGHKTGRLRILATSGAARSLPDVPTLRESGLDLAAAGWYGLFAPVGTRQDVVSRYEAIAVKSMQSPEVRAKVIALGMQPADGSAATLAARQKADADFWGPIVRASGFKPQQ